ncbi:hypothetical protein J6590_024546 [Homalodisca vitripennis]|nr:hypothetical protein J6590_024546 [Homalodisca vitripennis]
MVPLLACSFLLFTRLGENLIKQVQGESVHHKDLNLDQSLELNRNSNTLPFHDQYYSTLCCQNYSKRVYLVLPSHHKILFVRTTSKRFICVTARYRKVVHSQEVRPSGPASAEGKNIRVLEPDSVSLRLFYGELNCLLFR